MIDVQGVSHIYGQRKVLDDTGFRIARGSFAAVVGPNGAGKSTILHIMAGLIPVTCGALSVDGKSVAEYSTIEYAKKRAVLLQHEQFSFPYTVEELVGMGRTPHLGGGISLGRHDREVVERHLELLQLTALRHRRINTLSGGERKRALLARALVQEPEVLFLDEPLVALDLHHRMFVLGFLREQVRSRGLTVVGVLHDLNVVSEFCDHVVILKDGGVVASDQPAAVFLYPLLKRVFEVELYIGINEVTGKIFVHPFSTVER